MYDEFKQIGLDYSDTLNADTYDECMQRHRDYVREAEYILGLLEAGPDDRLLEIGTGTGHFAIEASRHVKHVTAADISEKMLSYARRKARKADRKNITWSHTGFLSHETPRRYDIIMSKMALHHLPDFWKAVALNRIHKMLKPEGRFYLADVVFSFSIEDYGVKCGEWIAQTIGLFGDENVGEEAAMHIREEYSTFDWIIEAMIRKAGFTFRIEKKSDFFAGYVCEKK